MILDTNMETYTKTLEMIEYEKLVTALNTTPLSKDDVFCCNSWKDYIEQYITNQMIIKK